MSDGVQINGWSINAGNVIVMASTALLAGLGTYLISRTQTEDRQAASSQQMSQIEMRLQVVTDKLDLANVRVFELSNRITRLEEASTNVKDAVNDLKRAIGPK